VAALDVSRLVVRVFPFCGLEVSALSAFVYGRLEAKRERSDSKKSSTTQPPGLKPYVDAIAALVPAEVLAANALFVAAFTDSKKRPDESLSLVITNRGDLRLAFFGLILLALVMYVLGHINFGKSTVHWDRWDFLRMLIPPTAFVGWAMAQRPSPSFDAATSISAG
jgi:hypothetical protein